MAMVDVGDSSLLADSQPKLVGLVWGSAASDKPGELTTDKGKVKLNISWKNKW